MYYGKSYPPLKFVFSHSPRDFVVEELPLYDFSGEGEHVILKLRKKNLSTPEALQLLAQAFKLPQRELGYAGLKDKSSLSYQYISLPLKAYKKGHTPLHENLKILETTLHANKLRRGHLRGNKFFIRLKKLDSHNFKRLSDEAHKALKQGFPNFFGFQRFGNFGDNYEVAKTIKKPIKKQSRKEQFLLSSLQSHYFNLWLEARLKLSNLITSLSHREARLAIQMEFGLDLEEDLLSLLKKSPLVLKPLLGDLCCHYPHGRLFGLDVLTEGELRRLEEGEVAITGLLSGQASSALESKRWMDSREVGGALDSECQLDSLGSKRGGANPLESATTLDSKGVGRTLLARGQAGLVEANYAPRIEARGSRRYAWVYPSDLSLSYVEHEAQALLEFSLPKGAYATSFLVYLKNAPLYPS